MTGAFEFEYLKSSSASAKAGKEPPSRKDVPRYIYGSKIELGFHIRFTECKLTNKLSVLS
jgi:hypothetical protein